MTFSIKSRKPLKNQCFYQLHFVAPGNNTNQTWSQVLFLNCLSRRRHKNSFFYSYSIFRFPSCAKDTWLMYSSITNKTLYWPQHVASDKLVRSTIIQALAWLFKNVSNQRASSKFACLFFQNFTEPSTSSAIHLYAF